MKKLPSILLLLLVIIRFSAAVPARAQNTKPNYPSSNAASWFPTSIQNQIRKSIQAAQSETQTAAQKILSNPVIQNTVELVTNSIEKQKATVEQTIHSTLNEATPQVSPEAVGISPESEYKTSINNGQITITKYLGHSSVLDIPRTIGLLPVVALGHRSFQGCTSLTEVTIPDSVSSIEGSAFCTCKNLTTITIPASVTTIVGQAFHYCPHLVSIKLDPANPKFVLGPDGVLFNKDKTILITYPDGKPDKTYEIPNGVTTIMQAAFASCTTLTSVTIPQGVTSILSHAFQACFNLSEITIPSSVAMISGAAFNECKNLSSVTFLGNAPRLENDVFKKTSPDLKIYDQTGATGFSAPIWNDGSLGNHSTPEIHSDSLN